MKIFLIAVIAVAQTVGALTAGHAVPVVVARAAAIVPIAKTATTTNDQ